MRVLRINEPQCPRCGRGRRSGYMYPSCAEVERHGLTFDAAHRLLCRNFSIDVCSWCSTTLFDESE